MVDRERAKQVAIREVERRIVTKQEAKNEFKAWIKRASKIGYQPDSVTEFWNEVIKQVDALD